YHYSVTDLHLVADLHREPAAPDLQPQQESSISVLP
ncbi:hypothetical protein A2U01_0034436, partial [Trifolium medium]|nr:hypothetical protein [Trifolium medium]